MAFLNSSQFTVTWENNMPKTIAFPPGVINKGDIVRVWINHSRFHSNEATITWPSSQTSVILTISALPFREDEPVILVEYSVDLANVISNCLIFSRKAAGGSVFNSLNSSQYTFENTSNAKCMVKFNAGVFQVGDTLKIQAQNSAYTFLFHGATEIVCGGMIQLVANIVDDVGPGFVAYTSFNKQVNLDGATIMIEKN